jgi:hypothetical protein
VVASRQDGRGVAQRLAHGALDFVVRAQVSDGRFRNRLGPDGRWLDDAATGDWWGRALWGLASAAVHRPDQPGRCAAWEAFERGLRHRSPWVRSMGFAALGVTLLMDHGARSHDMVAMLVDFLDMVPPAGHNPSWVWPEDRLSYANATLAEAVMASAHSLGRPAGVDEGLAMLSWLLASETAAGHLSVTPTRGRTRQDCRPGFDQQPIEVAAMAEACGRAYRLSGDHRWLRGLRSCSEWFAGANDAGLVMYDPRNAAAYDGLQPISVNLNQGAESSLALVATVQHVQRHGLHTVTSP